MPSIERTRREQEISMPAIQHAKRDQEISAAEFCGLKLSKDFKIGIRCTAACYVLMILLFCQFWRDGRSVMVYAAR